MKKWFKIFLCVSLLLSLTACLKKFDEKDVKNFIKENLSLSSFNILEGPVEVISPNESTDEWWTIETNIHGFKTPLEFHVINYHTFGKFGATNRLVSDYHGALIDKIVSEYNASGKMQIVKKDEYINEGSEFIYPVINRTSFKEAFADIESFQNHLNKYSHLEDLSILLQYQFALEEPMILKDKWFGNVIFKTDTTKAELTQMMEEVGEYSYECGNEYRYLVDCLRSGLLDRIQEFSEQEITKIVDSCTDIMEVQDTSENILKKNVIYSKEQDYIAVGNVYQLLPQEKVEGTWENFTFKDASGKTHSLEARGGDTLVHIEEVSKYLGVEVDDGVRIEKVHIPNEYFTYFGINQDAFEQDLNKKFKEYIRRYEKNEDGFNLYSKPYLYTRIGRVNDDEVDEIRQKLIQKYQKFPFSVSNMHQVYEGVTITLEKGLEITEEDYQAIMKALSLTAYNQLLFNQKRMKGTWEFFVELRFKEGDEVKKTKKAIIPNEVIDYQWFLK